MIAQQKETICNLSTEHQEPSVPCSAAAFWLPDLINLSAWLEHAPFAFWLVDAMRPTSIVELGVHHGYSYFAFCQAVQRLNLPTTCYAVDTWQGDEHSGFYGEEVFQQVNNYNQNHYANFSKLIRTTFDEALAYFLDDSIDILHIDGRHFYDDVKHDFLSWLPKLSNRALVLFHDTNVQERDFKVFQLWDEVRQIYPHFEFMHGYGLGVLGVGKSIAPKIKMLFAATDKAEAAQIHAMYARLGAAITDRYHLNNCMEQVAKLTMMTTTLQTETAKQQSQLIEIEKELLASTEENNQHETALHNLENRLEVLNQTSKIQEEQIIKQEELKRIVEAKLEGQEREMRQLKNQLSITEQALKLRETLIDQLGRTVKEIYSSKFWRLSWPIRRLLRIFS